MSNTTKIQKDYLRTRGIVEPNKEGELITVTYTELLEIVTPIADSQLLKVVVTTHKGTPDKILADRYQVNQNTIKSIKQRNKK